MFTEKCYLYKHSIWESNKTITITKTATVYLSMSENTDRKVPLSLKSIRELCKQTDVSDSSLSSVSLNFLIPSYQRGYRWTRLQVKQLFDDLWDFNKEQKQGHCWYCLQPLVVKKKEGEAKWIVVDGQQRLTTVFIILKALAVETKDCYSIEYETRSGSKAFLEAIETEASRAAATKNPDFHYMLEAYTEVQKLVESKVKKEDRGRFRDKILDDAKVIWYEMDEADDKGVFDRLNSGKISLSNAELIKALLLNIDNFEKKNESAARLQQSEMAQEWDSIEQTLHSNDFWCFITPRSDNPDFEKTRIDFIFALVFSVYRERYIQPNQPENIGTADNNPYHMFAVISEYLKTKDNAHEGVRAFWADVKVVFRTIKNWYENRETYHLVGFLMNQKGMAEKDKYDLLASYIKLATPKTEFLKKLKAESFKALGLLYAGDPGESVLLDTLTYGMHNNQITNVLLLFNIALLNRQSSEESRYPFKTHRGTSWSLEHIHAKEQRCLDVSEVNSLLEKCDVEQNAINKFNTLFKGDVEITAEQGGGGKYTLGRDGATVHGVENLALLERTHNSSLNNKLYLEKRAMLVEWEGCNQAEMIEKNNLPSFIPLGTRMAFFKHFSPDPNPSFVWSETDQGCYFDAIGKTLAVYLECTSEQAKLFDRQEG